MLPQPPPTQSTPQPELQRSHHVAWTLLISLATLLLLGGGLYAFLLLTPIEHGLESQPPRASRYEQVEVPRELLNVARAGDYQAAYELYSAIQNDPLRSRAQKAWATYFVAGVLSRLTGDPKARLTDIQNLKEVVRDQQMPQWIRANTLNILAGQYSFSANDPAVFAEIFKDAPFSDHLVPNDPRRSSLKLFEWSYAIMPTSFAAISIARWYTEQAVLNPNQDANTTKEYVGIAVDYLNKADAASLQEAQEEEDYTDGGRYLVYRYWRAVVVGRLAAQIGEPYLSRYRAEYEKFIAFAQLNASVQAKEYLLYARLFFARRLQQDGDSTAAVTQLANLAQDMNAVTNPDSNVFIRFLRSEKTNRPTGETWRMITDLAALSPSFEGELVKITGPY